MCTIPVSCQTRGGRFYESAQIHMDAWCGLNIPNLRAPPSLGVCGRTPTPRRLPEGIDPPFTLPRCFVLRARSFCLPPAVEPARTRSASRIDLLNYSKAEAALRERRENDYPPHREPDTPSRMSTPSPHRRGSSREEEMSSTRLSKHFKF